MLQNSALLLPQQYDNMTTLQHNGGAGPVLSESQLSEIKMLIMNQMQPPGPTMIDHGASAFSTIQGVEYNHQGVDPRSFGGRSLPP